MPMREQKPGRGEDEFTTKDRDSEGSGEECERSDADNRLGGEKELPQPSRTTYLKNSEHRLIALNIAHKRKKESVCSFM